MTFRLHGLDPIPFEPLFALGDASLARRGMRRVVADDDVGYPCRVALEDARIGEELLLLHWQHVPGDSPYRASGPIFVRRRSRQPALAPGEVPAYVNRRLISLRAYDAAWTMLDARVCEGADVAGELALVFRGAAVACVQLHNARRGCYSCVAYRA